MALPADLLRLESPINQPLTIVQGDDHSIPLDFQYDNGDPLDLTGVTAWTAEVYNQPGGSLLATLTVGAVSLALGQLTIGYTKIASGALTFTGDAQSATIGIWYLRATDGSAVVTTHTGSVTLIKPK